MIRTFASFNVGQTGKIVFRLSLLEQDVDTSNFEYEKYGATPSPEYPSPVICLGSNTDGSFKGSTEIKMKNADETQEKSYTLPIQQEMLKGDYFIKEADGWKEVHVYGKSIITENADIVLSSATVDYIEFRINNALNSNSPNNYLNTYSNLFSNKANNRCMSYNNYLLCRVPADLKITTVEEFKEILQENNLVVYYKLASQVELECTEEQTAVLEELNNMDLFEGVNNIITAEDIALLKLKYALDVETYVDNKIDEKLANINQQILNIAGGN